jgi:hypothetical protein
MPSALALLVPVIADVIYCLRLEPIIAAKTAFPAQSRVRTLSQFILARNMPRVITGFTDTVYAIRRLGITIEFGESLALATTRTFFLAACSSSQG